MGIDFVWGFIAGYIAGLSALGMWYYVYLPHVRRLMERDGL